MKENKVMILCSGVALGVYIPAILLDYQLRTRGISTEVIVLETLLKDEKILKIADNKKFFHKNFRVALKGQSMATDILPSCDINKVEKILENWILEACHNFIIFSGFWMPIISEYMNRVKYEKINIDIIHMDADISASWKLFEKESKKFNNIWLFRWEEKKILYGIPVNADKPVNYAERNDRYVIHGGGWGMGTYQSKIPELEDASVSLDIVAYDINETNNSKKCNNRYFMIDPGWSPLMKNNENRHEFPPFGEIIKNDKTVFKNRQEYHELYDVIRTSKAVISKPGGATLLDSLSSATPLIMLEPFGDYEKKNADLWEYLGFGISYNKWKDSGYSVNILEAIYDNLIKNKFSIDYVSEYIKSNQNY